MLFRILPIKWPNLEIQPSCVIAYSHRKRIDFMGSSSNAGNCYILRIQSGDWLIEFLPYMAMKPASMGLVWLVVPFGRDEEQKKEFSSQGRCNITINFNGKVLVMELAGAEDQFFSNFYENSFYGEIKTQWMVLKLKINSLTEFWTQ